MKKVEWKSPPTEAELQQWRMNKARLNKLLRDLEEDESIDLREIMTRDDRSSLTNEEAHIGAKFMELMDDVYYPQRAFGFLQEFNETVWKKRNGK